MTFTQNFTSIADSLGWTALVATVPILYFFWALAIKKMKGYVAGLTTLALAIIIAIIGFQVPVATALASASQGAVYGIVPIGWSMCCNYW